MSKIMKGTDITIQVLKSFFSRTDSDRTRGHRLRVKKRRVMTRNTGIFTRRLVDTWNGLLRYGR